MANPCNNLDKFMYQFWQIHVSILANPFNNSENMSFEWLSDNARQWSDLGDLGPIKTSQKLWWSLVWKYDDVLAAILLYLPWSQVRNDQLVLTEAASPWERCKIAELQCTPRSLGLLSPFIQPGDDDNGDDLYIMLMWHLFVCHVLSSCRPYIMLNWRLTWRPALPWIGKPKAPKLSPLKKPTQKLYLPSKCAQP